MIVLARGEILAQRFEIERAAGQGGMATVYRARDHLTGGLVALKILGPLREDLGEADRFAREVQFLAELRHPGIVSYVGHGQAPNGQRFLAMEWLEGEDLAQHLSRRPLSLHDALTLVRRVTEALSAAHERGIVHRDQTHKTKIWLRSGDSGVHRRRAGDAFLLLAPSAS